MDLTADLRAEYQRLWDTCQIRNERRATVTLAADRLLSNQLRYEAAGNPLSLPWYFVAVIHNMESSQGFDRHLHNGDPLTARTVQVPADRPILGTPPFTWEESAEDALSLHTIGDVWSIPDLLYEIERFNGWGYRKYHPETLSPYLWSFTNHYTAGKYVADGKWDPDAVSAQCGAAALLLELSIGDIAAS